MHQHYHFAGVPAENQGWCSPTGSGWCAGDWSSGQTDARETEWPAEHTESNDQETWPEESSQNDWDAWQDDGDLANED